MKKFNEIEKTEAVKKFFQSNPNGMYNFSSDVSLLNDLVIQEFDGFITQMNRASRFIDKTTYNDGVYGKQEIPYGVIDDNWDLGVCSPVGTTASFSYVSLDVCDQGKMIPFCLVDMRRKYFGLQNMGGAVPDVLPFFNETIDAIKEKLVRRRDKIAIQGLSGCSQGAIYGATTSGVVISGTSSFATSTTTTNGILGTLQAVTAAASQGAEAWLLLNPADFATFALSVFAVNGYHINPYDVVATDGGYPLPWAPNVKVYTSIGGEGFSVSGYTHFALLHYEKYTYTAGYFGNGTGQMASYNVPTRDFIIDTMFGIDTKFVIPTANEKPVIALG